MHHLSRQPPARSDWGSHPLLQQLVTSDNMLVVHAEPGVGPAGAWAEEENQQEKCEEAGQAGSGGSSGSRRLL